MSRLKQAWDYKINAKQRETNETNMHIVNRTGSALEPLEDLYLLVDAIDLPKNETTEWEKRQYE